MNDTRATSTGSTGLTRRSLLLGAFGSLRPKYREVTIRVVTSPKKAVYAYWMEPNQTMKVVDCQGSIATATRIAENYLTMDRT